MFRDGQRDFVQQFGAYQRAGDAESMVRAAHTLKGIAGSIGAPAVYEAARALESACREQPTGEPVSRLLAEVGVALSPLVEALEHLGSERDSGVSQQRGVQADDLRPLLQRLRGRLADFDAESVELAEDLGERLRGTRHERAATRLQTLVERFDFEEACTVVDELSASLALALD